MRNPFGKPDLKVESDEQGRGTPFRTCSLLIETGELSGKDLERIRAALAPLMRNVEVSVVGGGMASLIDKKKVTRVRVNYYGSEIPAEKVVAAVRSVL
jgi:hypothetical protein